MSLPLLLSLQLLVFPFWTENNGLLFLETSALDSTNVELAFETVLKGQSPCLHWAPHRTPEASMGSGGMQIPSLAAPTASSAPLWTPSLLRASLAPPGPQPGA